MTAAAWSARARGPRLGALAVALVATAGAPGLGRADVPSRTYALLGGAAARGSSGGSARRNGLVGGERSAVAPLTVAVGATSGEARARAMFTSALSDAIAQNPSLRLAPEGATRGAAIVLSAHVRALTVQRDAVGALARCDVGLVVADGSGAVRAMMDARRTVRADGAMSDETLARTVLRGALDGAMRNLVSQLGS